MAVRNRKIMGMVFVVSLICGVGHALAAQHEPHLQTRHDTLKKVSTYMTAGDYRRALEECQRSLESSPSARGYVYLTYVYQAIDAYLTVLDRSEQWVAVEHLYLNLAYREAQDLIDPPGGLARMAKETIQISVRQQGDVTAAMATRLDREETGRLWMQQAAWRTDHPDEWWFSIPEVWLNDTSDHEPPVGGMP
jgi:hypothetical protein